MGFKSPWFQFLVLCLLCVSTVANSKPLPVKLTSEDCGETCSTAKEGIVHKIEPRDVRQDYTPEYRRASETNQEELLNIDSLSDFDIEESDDDDGELPDESNSSGDGSRKLGGAHVDDTVDYGIDWLINRELPEKIIHDTVNDTSDDSAVVNDDTPGDDDDDTPEDDHDTFAADDDDATSGADDDDTSGGHDDYADDFFDETQDNHEDSDDNDNAPNSPDDDDDTFGVNDDDDDYESNAEETLEDDDDDTHGDADGDVDHEINSPDDDDDNHDEAVNLDHTTETPNDDDDNDEAVNLDHMTETPNSDDDNHDEAVNHDHMTETPNDDDDNDDKLVNLDHMTDTPNDDDDTFRVDVAADDSIKLPEQTLVKGQKHVLEEHPHKSTKVTHHHNPLNKHPHSKLGRLLKKHHNTDITSGKSGRKNLLHEDIYDDDFEYNDFEGQKTKGKIPTHKGRRTLSLDENSDFEHVETDTSGKDDSVEGNTNHPDKPFSDSPGDNVQQAGSALVQEDPIEGEEEEENQRANAASSVSVSDNDEEIKATYSTSKNLSEENGQHYEEDKIEGEEEEEEANEMKVDDGSVLNSDRKAVIGKEFSTDSEDQDEMSLGA